MSYLYLLIVRVDVLSQGLYGTEVKGCVLDKPYLAGGNAGGIDGKIVVGVDLAFYVVNGWRRVGYARK